MKAREFERILQSEGCVLVKKDGDHHVWMLPNGRRFDVPFGGKQNELKSYLVTKYRRLLRGDVRCE